MQALACVTGAFSPLTDASSSLQDRSFASMGGCLASARAIRFPFYKEPRTPSLKSV